MDNYPDNWSWGAYDDYHDSKLTCGHFSSEGCDCWCKHYLYNAQHLKGECHPTNCALHLCMLCGCELNEGEVKEAQDADEERTCATCLKEEG